MATVHLVPYFDDVRAKGLYKIRVCISIGSKKTFRSTGKKTSKNDWDESAELLKLSAQNASVINGILKDKKGDAERTLLLMELNKEKITIANFKRKFSGKAVSEDFFTYSTDLVEDKRKKWAEGTTSNYETTIEKIKAFSPQLTFPEITPLWLRKLESYFLDEDLSVNTITGHWKRLKKIVNDAVSDGAAKEYPFSKYDNPKYRQTIRTYLNQGEIEAWESALLLPMNPALYKCGMYFLLGCYSGLRISDWRRFNPAFIRGVRLVLYAKKTGEIVSMKIHDKLQAVIDKLLLLPPLAMEDQTINENVRAVGKIAGIEKYLTSHVARHSFAVRCAELGIPIAVCCEYMGITERECKTYYRITGTLLDKEILKFNLSNDI